MDRSVPSTIRVSGVHRRLDVASFPAGSDYVRTFWLPIIGPTALLAHEQLAGIAERHPGTVVDVADLAARLGVGHRGTSFHSPCVSALRRLGDFRLASVDLDLDPAVIVVHLDVPRLHRAHLDRLPTSLRDLHDLTMRAVA